MFESVTFPITPAVAAFSVVAAIVPTFFLVAVVYWVDRYEKEPIWLLAAAFLWGAIPSIIAAFILNTVFSIPPTIFLGPQASDIVGASLIAPPVEESMKGLALLGILRLWRHELDSPLDGIIYGAMVGLGFAMVENIYYFLNVYAEGGSGALGVNIVLRAIVFGLNHAMFTSMTGLGIAVARLSPRKSIKLAAPFAGWSAAVFTHFIHNLSASIGGLLCLVSLFNAWGGLLLMGIIVVWALVQERQWLRTYLEEEVERGTLSRQQYSRTHSSWRALSHRVSLLFNQGLSAYLDATRFYHRCSELAYKKHHLATLNDTKSGEMIARLRDEVGQLSRNLG